MLIEEPATIKNCEFSCNCPRQWDELEPTANKAVRFCGTCDRGVYLAEDRETLAVLAAVGKCVAFVGRANTAEEDQWKLNPRISYAPNTDPETDVSLDPK